MPVAWGSWKARMENLGDGRVLKREWRPRPELNRRKRFCRPLRNHSATWPGMSAELFTPAGGRAPYTGPARERQWREPCVFAIAAAKDRRVLKLEGAGSSAWSITPKRGK